MDRDYRPDTADLPEPFYPILSVEEVEEGTDLRDKLPEELQVQLGAADRVIHIATPEIRRPQLRPSVVREIIRISNASSLKEIGYRGAPVAGLSSVENVDVEALRKFEVAHGRDALEEIRSVHDYYPKLSETTILELAETQGTQKEMADPTKPLRQEERGRIILLARDPEDPIGQKFARRLNWGTPFYGSIDATPSYVSAIATHAREHDENIFRKPYEDKDGNPQTIEHAFDLSVDWIVEKLDENPEGLLEFKNTDPRGGMDTQAWKDSAFAYIHANGERANLKEGVASVEVQSRAYDALLDAAEIYEGRGDVQKSRDLIERANKLREHIFTTFWVGDDDDETGYPALATDRDENGELRKLEVKTSNMGHLLNSRLFDDSNEATLRKRDAIVRHLFSTEMLHTSGIRTLASDEKAFRAGGYHTGSVWLWDTAFIADGLERQGYVHLGWELRKHIWQTVEELGTFPEFVCGDIGGQIRTNPSEVYVYNSEHDVLHLFEQPTQEIQGWTVTALVAAKRRYLEYKKNIDRISLSDTEHNILCSLPDSLLRTIDRTDLLEKAGLAG